LIPYEHTILSVRLPIASVKQRLEGLIRDGDPKRLELGQNYWVWRRAWGLILFARPDWVNLYSPVATLRLSATDAGTAVEITFIAPGVLLLVAWLVSAAGLIGKFRYWGGISEMAIVALGVHVASYIFYRRELRDIADDLGGVFSDAEAFETP
jgi:hypothetical protein